MTDQLPLSKPYKSRCAECRGHGSFYITAEGPRVECKACNGTGRAPKALPKEPPRAKPQHRGRKSSGQPQDEDYLTESLRRKYNKSGHIFLSQFRYGDHRLDGLAVSHGTSSRVIGFEIKTEVYDFRQELESEKWRAWTPHTTEFYFVSPPGILNYPEIPDGCGLLEVDDRGIVRERKPSARRNAWPQWPESFEKALFRRLATLEGYVL